MSVCNAHWWPDFRDHWRRKEKKNMTDPMVLDAKANRLMKGWHGGKTPLRSEMARETTPCSNSRGIECCSYMPDFREGTTELENATPSSMLFLDLGAVFDGLS